MHRKVAEAQKFPWVLFGEEIDDQHYQCVLATILSADVGWYERNRSDMAADAAYAAVRGRLHVKLGGAVELPESLGDHAWAKAFMPQFRDELDRAIARTRRPYLAYLQRVSEAIADTAPAKDPAVRCLMVDEFREGRLRHPLKPDASGPEALALVIAIAPINRTEDRRPLLMLPVEVDGEIAIRPAVGGSPRLFTAKWLPDQNSPVFIDPDALLGADEIRWSGDCWQEALSKLDEWWSSVTGCRVGEAGEWLDGSRKLAFDIIKAPNTDSSIVEAYRKASGVERLSGLLSLVVGDVSVAPASKPQQVDLASEERDSVDHLGHMDEQKDQERQGFALDASQRLAAWHASALGSDDPAAPKIIAVNGPPGTGKTSFLRSVLSSFWVRDALDGKPSPRWVVATGATNKAVSNVIEAFGSVAGKVPGEITTRWIPGLPSYGWFLASSERVRAARKKGNATQTIPTRSLMVMHRHQERPFQEDPPIGADDEVRETVWAADFAAAPFQIQFEKSLDEMVEAWRSNAGMYFRKPEIKLDDAVLCLREVLKSKHQALQTDRGRLARSLWAAFQGMGEAGGRMSRRPEIATGRVRRFAAETERQADVARRDEREATELEDVIRTGQAFHAARSDQATFEGSWFAWLFRKRGALLGEAVNVAEMAYLSAIKGTRAEERATLNGRTLYDHDLVARMLSVAKEAAKEAVLEYNRALTAETRLRGEAKRRREALLKLSTALETDIAPASFRSLVRDAWHKKTPGCSFEQAIESILDKKHRFELFHVAARYWEGRWLQDRLKDREDGRTRSAAKEFDPSAWMKLGVIMVGTLPRLSNLAKEFNTMIDVLIVDEAGQATVDGGLWLFGSARSALLLGDTHQLEPIYPLPKKEDERHMSLAGLDQSQVPEEMTTHAGSMMAIAQRYTAVTDSDTPAGGGQPPGIMLRTHYRCAPVIAEFCNKLRYQGRMKMARAFDAEGSKLKRMAWVDVKGNAERAGSSWTNRAEVEAIAMWVRAKGREICQTIGDGKKLDEVLAIISPMAAQARLLSDVLRPALAQEFGDDVVGRMIIGTVHRLQGAERPVVAMSLAQTMAPLFADRDGGKLVNVAVSRAKEQFVLFGNCNIMRVVPGTPEPGGQEPTARLSRYMRLHGARLFPERILFVPAGADVRNIQAGEGVDTRVIQLDSADPEDGRQARWIEAMRRYPDISKIDFHESCDESDRDKVTAKAQKR